MQLNAYPHPGRMAVAAPAPTRAQPRATFRDRIAAIVMVLALGLGGIAWIPVFGGLEVNNFAAFAIILLTPLAMRPGARPPALILLLLAAMVYVVATLLVRSSEEVAFLLRPVVYTVAAIGIAMMRYPRRADRLAVISIVFLLASFAISATYAGVSLYDGVIENLVTLNRHAFVRNTIKATFNAFAGNDRMFAASNINLLAAYLMMGFSYFAAYGRYIMAALMAVGVVILFSSSSMLTLLFLSVLLITRAVKSARGWIIVLAGFSLAGGVVAAYYEPISAYVAENVESDTASREGRMTQYSYALDQVNDNPLFGSGVTRTAAGTIHNLVLFVWSNSGIIPMLMLLVFYSLLGLMLLYAIYMFYAVEVGWIAVIGLLTVFIFRTLVGGGGGLPSVVAAVAIGLAFLEFDRLRKRAGVAPANGLVALTQPRHPMPRLR